VATMGTNEIISVARDLLLFVATAAIAVRFSKSSGSSPTVAADLQQRLEAGTTLDASEIVCTVTESNVPTPTGHPRKEVRLNNLWHRATYIIVRHEEDGRVNDGDDSHDDASIHFLVQRRSKLKDYCPRKLDPAPGGVVSFGEECIENAKREIEEEMGIDVTNPASPHAIRKIFTFPYEDTRVRCWGDLFEVQYKGRLEDIRCQQEEVDEVLRMSLADIKKSVGNNGGDWMPDGVHALKLYLQHRHDNKVGRRLLHGYSCGSLDAYGLRPKPKAIFFDCDDCLYFDDWNTASHLTEKIEQFCVERKGLPRGEAYKLYKQHGTALRGLLAEKHVEHSEEAIDEYLEEVHDLPIHELLGPDVELQRMLSEMDPSIPKYIFTASVRHHAERCLQALGIHEHFEDIIDVKACNLCTKHSDEAFQAAMRIAGVDEPEACIFLDDSVKNIEAARRIGWRSILVGRIGRDCGTRISSEHSEHEIDRIHEFRNIYPELFEKESRMHRSTSFKPKEADTKT